MYKKVEMNRITGTAKTFDVSIVEEGYIRTYSGMIAFGKKKGNKGRDELSVTLSDLKIFVAEVEAEAALERMKNSE